ncbi:serine/threonine-protein kinase [Actinomadura rubrisoli]|uniref:non-specific serine/threonine protein kinase n=1 Tax=Actinomadura rubrisoli TaxID=2530368 RepID=A0A4V2YV79_9ACTN|nr:serine/threonine-protein kinase [Actinomadura rubrisoli]TDD80367.1 serine/threonine protein kinase [Actinomadura rubrisoli]
MSEGRLIRERYRLERLVGQGGMGRVWRARDEILGRDVAVKEIVAPPGLSASTEDELRERAMREARSAARLSHPAVITVHDVVEQDGQPWVIMEFLRARSLQEIVDVEGPLADEQAARIGLQIVSALVAAHSDGVLHRDVKPANVLRTDDGRIVLTDFGIAVIQGDSTLTRTGGLVGSPAYIAPERINGERATEAADLWALGATLYTLVEGRPPFARLDPVAVYGAILNHAPDPMRRAGVLRPVIEALLTKDPRVRMKGPAATTALAGIAGGTPAAAADQPAPPRPASPTARPADSALSQSWDLGTRPGDGPQIQAAGRESRWDGVLRLAPTAAMLGAVTASALLGEEVGFSLAELHDPTVIDGFFGTLYVVVAAVGMLAVIGVHVRSRARSPYLSPVAALAGVAALASLPLVHFDDTWHSVMFDPSRHHLSWALVTLPSALWLLTAGGLMRAEGRSAYVLWAALAALALVYFQLDAIRSWGFVPPREVSYLLTVILVLAMMAFRLRTPARRHRRRGYLVGRPSSGDVRTREQQDPAGG